MTHPTTQPSEGAIPEASIRHPFNDFEWLLQNDLEYAWAFHSNIAMPIMDVIGCTHQQANEAAAFVMQTIWRVDVTKHPHYAYAKSPAQEYFEMRVAAEQDEDLAKATGKEGC